MMTKVIRQGDVYLIKIKELPKGLKEKNKVLAFGEVTGHSHRFESSARVMVDVNGLQYASLSQTDTLIHEEHANLKVEGGLYEVRIQREYSPLEGVRQVMD